MISTISSSKSCPNLFAQSLIEDFEILKSLKNQFFPKINSKKQLTKVLPRKLRSSLFGKVDLKSDDILQKLNSEERNSACNLIS